MTKNEEVAAGEAQVLDVRTEDEWAGGHAEYALHIPVDDLLRGEMGALDSNKKVYTYCAAGGRAGRAAKYLREHGFQAENVGGLKDWLAG